jgi:RecG-like helicase
MEASRFGLCDQCVHQQLVRSGRGSEFSMCRLGLQDPDWPKYPRMPVLRCPRFERVVAPPAVVGQPEV